LGILIALSTAVKNQIQYTVKPQPVISEDIMEKKQYMNKNDSCRKSSKNVSKTTEKNKVLHFALRPTKIINTVLLIPTSKSLSSPQRNLTDNYLLQNLTFETKQCLFKLHVHHTQQCHVHNRMISEFHKQHKLWLNLYSFRSQLYPFSS
jgi:hypothetical protein